MYQLIQPPTPNKTGSIDLSSSVGSSASGASSNAPAPFLGRTVSGRVAGMGTMTSSLGSSLSSSGGGGGGGGGGGSAMEGVTRGGGGGGGGGSVKKPGVAANKYSSKKGFQSFGGAGNKLS